MPHIQINGVVHQRQQNVNACWYTCLQMVVRYYESLSGTCMSFLTGPEHFPHMQSRYEAARTPSWAEWSRWAGECGFTPLNITPNATGLYGFLSDHGPIIYAGTWGMGFDGHAVVVTGINTGSDTLYIDDPGERTAPVTKNMTTYFGRLRQTLTDNPLFVYQ